MLWKGHSSLVLFMFQFLLHHFSLGSTKCKGNQDLVMHPFWPHKDVWIQVSVRLHFQSGTVGSEVQQLHLLVAQSFPGDTAEEGMTLDVTHTSTSRTQAIARVKLKQLWSSIMYSEDSVRLNYPVCVLQFWYLEHKPCGCLKPQIWPQWA